MQRIAIAGGSPETAAAGARIAGLGGNATDVAAAAALTATVAEVLMASLGGSAFLMVRRPGRTAELIDGGDMAPDVAGRQPPGQDAFRSVHLPYGDGIEVMAGHASVGVPGMLAAVELAWKRHGTLPWSEIVAPALELARQPIPLGRTTADWLGLAGRLLFFEQPESRGCFFRDGDRPLREGELFQIPDLAQSFEAISEQGAAALYCGDLGILFAREIVDHGGLVSRRDLANYQALVRKPLTARSAGFNLALNPAPAVGGAAVGMLIHLLESEWRRCSRDAERARLWAQVQSCLVRLRTGGSLPSECQDAAVRRFLEGTHLARHARALQSPHTTHLSVASEDGWLVSVTMSNGYGSGITIPGTGIPCNNSLGEPELNPHGYHSAPAASRLISNMAPTVAWHSDGRCLAIGSPGASRITTSIAQVWARYAFEGAGFEKAVTAPRLHVESFEDGIRAQCEPGIDTSLLTAEFTVRSFDRPDMYFGAVKLAGIDAQGRVHAVADERRHGGVEIVG